MDLNEKPFGLSEIGQVAVQVTDLERAIRFYRDQLGISFLFQAPPGLAFFDCGGVRLLLDLPAGANGAGRSSLIYFKVADIKAAVSALIAREVVFDQPPALIAEMPDHDLWMAFFHDPDGNPLALMSEMPR